MPLPEGFSYLSEVVPDIVLEPRYYSTFNFVGARVDGYNEPKIILSLFAAAALLKANNILRAKGYCLKVWDGYRPQRAVRHFQRWAEDIEDVKMKPYFYPDVDKRDLFKLGYIAERSSHSRGSTVDLTLIDMRSGKEVDMGGQFDYFGEISHHGTSLVTQEQTANRNILREAMEEAGFEPYAYEWWHYTLKNEPFKDSYFDFPVE